jgi:hypothetical protein
VADGAARQTDRRSVRSKYGEYKRCKICGQHGFENTHRCPPAWQVQISDRPDEEWRTVHASYADDAAKKFAENYDRDDGCYPIVSDGLEMTLKVRKAYDDDAPIERYSARGEAVPTY